MLLFITRTPLVPRAAGVLATVEVADPWSAGTRTRFEVTDFELVSAHNGRRLGGHVVGLRNARNGEEKLLPEAMVLLWRDGEVASEQLPALLHASEHRYGMRDAQLVMSRTLHVWTAAMFALLAVPCLVFAFFGWAQGRAAAPHAVHEETLGGLSSRPLHDYESIRTNDAVPVLGASTLDASPPTDPMLVVMPGAARLVVVSMGTRKRLVWTTLPTDRVALIGVVWPAHALDAGAQAAVERLARQFPDVERAYVIGQMWMWTDAYASGLGLWIGLGFAALFVAGAVLVYAIVERRKAVRRRERIYLRELAASSSRGEVRPPLHREDDLVAERSDLARDLSARRVEQPQVARAQRELR